MGGIRIAIGIQARSTSSRLPNKVAMNIADRPMIDHVMNNCLAAARKFKHKEISAKVYLLIPEGDPVGERAPKPVTVIEGPEGDVLTRYMLLCEKEYPDYVVRITGDCPLIPPWLICAHINKAIERKCDYVTNTLAESRTAPDGWDCEVISLKMMHWLQQNSIEPLDREHVTYLLRRQRPTWEARIGHTIGFLDLEDINLSVDNQSELDAVRKQMNSINKKIAAAKAQGDLVFRL